MGSTLIHGASILTVDADDSVFEDGWVAIRDGRIGGVGPRATRPDPKSFDEVFELAGHLVMPGLVNAHTHSAMVLVRVRSEGQSLRTMEGWYNSIRETELSLEGAEIGPAVALSCAEMALSGTTTFCDQYFFAEEIAGAVKQAGLRAVIAYGIVQLGDEARGEQELANQFGVGLPLHLAAGPEDNEESMARYGKTAPVALEALGFFDGRLHAAHCLDLSDEDIAVFARAPSASVAY